MKSLTTADFQLAYGDLPPEIKTRARIAFKLWQKVPRHPSLRFKKIGKIGSVRVGSGYRALALLKGDTYYWFWIGTHDEYMRLLKGK